MNQDWKGFSIDEIFDNGDKWSNQYIPITPSPNQSVLFHIPLSDENQPPQPQRGVDSGWDRDNVRLPCHPESYIAQIDENGKKVLKSRWEHIIKSLSQPIQNSHELEKAIKSYNEQYADVWDFSSLHELFDQIPESKNSEFFSIVLPKMIDLVLDLPQLIQCRIPLLKQGMNRSISMSQQQVACLLANAFLCTFPYRNKARKHSDYSNYPEINFNRLFESQGQKVIEKLKCILNYFHRVLCCGMPCGVVTFFRRSKTLNIDWENESFPLSLIKYHISSTMKIEDASGMLQVDFANKFIGGGVLGHGCVQEEIRFMINPELIVAKLFTECMEDNEALLVIGCEKFNDYTGYASTFKFEGNFIDETPSDIYRRRKTRIVAIDALNYSLKNNQFEENSIRRELNKATVGFQSIRTGDAIDSSPVASGLWGCGAFNGYSIRSAVIQFMACCVSQRNLAFFTFGDETAKDEIYEIFEFLSHEQVNVGKLYRILKQFQFDLMSDDPKNLISFIKKQVQITKGIESQNSSRSLLPAEISQVNDTDHSTNTETGKKVELRQQKLDKLFNFQPVYKKKPQRIDPSTSKDPQTSSSVNDFDRVKSCFDVNVKTSTEKSQPQLEIVNEKRKVSLLDCLDKDYSK